MAIQPKDEAPAQEQSNLEKALGLMVERLEATKPNKRGHSRRDWPDRVIPETVSPGMAIVSDERGRSRKLIPLYFVMQHASKVRPIENQFSGAPAMTGALVDKVASRQMIVEQFAKYPEGHLVKGHGKLFDYSGYTEINGVYFHPMYVPKKAG